MLHKKILGSLALTSALLVAGASFAASAESSHCILQSRQVTHVTPYKVQERVGRSTVTKLAGAQVFVQAEPGLTAQWLQLTLARHISEMRGPTSMKDCALDLDDVSVKVDPAGSGFSVKLIAKNSKQAEEVLRRARLLAK